MSTNTANFASSADRDILNQKRAISAHDYDDIINTIYPFVDRPRNQRLDPDTRAAEFAPFAALTGYHETIEQTEDQNISDANRDHYELYEPEKP